MAPVPRKTRDTASDFYVPDNILDRAEDVLSPTTGRIKDENKPGVGSDPIQMAGDSLLSGYVNTILGAVPGLNLVAPAVTSHIAGKRAQGDQVSLLDPFGARGTREARIKELAEAEGIGDKYNSDNNTYSHLGKLVDTYVHGIRADDVTSKVVRDTHSKIKDSTEYQYLKGQLGRQEVEEKYGPLVSGSKVKEEGKTLKDRKDLITKIQGYEKGGGLLEKARADANGKQLSVGQLKAIEAQAIRTKPLTETEQANLNLTNQQIQASKDGTKIARSKVKLQEDQLDVQRDQLGLNTKIADNNQTLAIAKLAHADRVAQQQVDIANIKLRNQSAQANADRELRRDLAMLTRGDSKDERAYRRERDERKDRQMMIMQLLNGLKNSASGFVF